MIFIPPEYEPLSNWLDREAQELFQTEYPPAVTDLDITAFAEKCATVKVPTLPPGTTMGVTAIDPTLEPSAIVKVAIALKKSGWAIDPTLEPSELSKVLPPLLLKAFKQNQAWTDSNLIALADHRQIARSTLDGERAKKINELKERAFRRHHDHFYDGGFETIVIAADGSMQHIEPHIWGSDDAARMVATCSLAGRPILIKTIHKAKPGRKACLDWLLELMRGSPKMKTAAKGKLIAEAKSKFDVGPRAFDEQWRKALKIVPPDIANIWDRSGPLKGKRKPRR